MIIYEASFISSGRFSVHFIVEINPTKITTNRNQSLQPVFVSDTWMFSHSIKIKQTFEYRSVRRSSVAPQVKQPLKPPGGAAPGGPLPAPESACAEVGAGSEAPCSENPHLSATTSEVEPTYLQQQQVYVCVSVCLIDAYDVFSSCLSVSFLALRSSWPVTLTSVWSHAQASSCSFLSVRGRSTYLTVDLLTCQCVCVWDSLSVQPPHFLFRSFKVTGPLSSLLYHAFLSERDCTGCWSCL